MKKRDGQGQQAGSGTSAHPYQIPAPPSSNATGSRRATDPAVKARAMEVLLKALDGPVSGTTKGDRDRGRQIATIAAAPGSEVAEGLRELDGEAAPRRSTTMPAKPRHVPRARAAARAGSRRRITRAVALQRMERAVATALAAHMAVPAREALGEDDAKRKWRAATFFAKQVMAEFATKNPASWTTSASVLKDAIAAVIKVADRDKLIPEIVRPFAAKGAAEALKAAIDAVKNAMDGEGEAESGWNIALRRSSGTQQPSPQHAGATRERIRAAAAPAFAAALDRAVDANLLRQFAAKHPGGVDAAKLRTAYAETANRAFAADFVRLVGGQPPSSAENIALGAIIAVAIAQTSARFPIVPPAAVAPMAVLVHRALRPRLAELARMAAVIATPVPAQRAATSQAAHETAW